MKKEMVMLGGLLVVVVLLIILILMAVNPEMFIKMGFEPWGTPILIRNMFMPHNQESTGDQGMPCPSELAVYYTIDRSNTSTFSDDIIYISIRNPELQDYNATLFVDGVSEARSVLKAGVTQIMSGKVTSWWRAGEARDARNFGVDITIDGCNKTLAELSPRLTHPAPDAAGASGGGPDRGSGGGSEVPATNPPVPTTIAPDGSNRTIIVNFVKIPGYLPD